MIKRFSVCSVVHGNVKLQTKDTEQDINTGTQRSYFFMNLLLLNHNT